MNYISILSFINLNAYISDFFKIKNPVKLYKTDYFKNKFMHFKIVVMK